LVENILALPGPSGFCGAFLFWVRDGAAFLTMGAARWEDLADVLELVRATKLPAEFAASLDPYVREKYSELWRAAQIEDRE